MSDTIGTPRTLVVIQARMGSTRLAGKVLAAIGRQPMLGWVAERVARASRVSEICVATSVAPADDAIEAFCRLRGIRCVRGSELDVLDRFYQAARTVGADSIVRITADCPFIDPGVMDQVIAARERDGADYASNIAPATFPDGLDVEVFTLAALTTAWQSATKPSEREHVTPYLRHSEGFRRSNVECGLGLELALQRWTVDEASDLEFARAIYHRLGERSDFGWQDIVRLLQENPEINGLQGKAIMNEGYYRSLYQQAVAGSAPPRSVANSQTWLARSRRVIPGVAQTFSKSVSQYVQGVSPVFLQRGQGCRVWDVDGNEYVDYVQGLLPNILGYAHPEVNAAAVAQLGQGHSFSLPHPLEVELAERLVALIPCAEKVRFGKNGSDATAGAIRAARALTGRDRVACCGYHGWQDWFIGSTTRSRGVPEAVRRLTHPFPYNDLGALDRLLSEHPGKFAAVILEPVNFTSPAPGYLAGVKELAQRHGALLIFDEICTGFHLGLGGAQKLLGVVPDLACFGKAMGNGFPIACVVGRADLMDIFDEVFFSFTFGGEVASFAACLKVLEIMETTDAYVQMNGNGRRLQDGFNALSQQAGLYPRLECVGFPVWSLLKFRNAAGQDSLLERSLWQQEVVKRGILQLVTHNLTAAHDAAAVEKTLEAYAAVFKTLAGWLADPNPQRFLEGPMIQAVFQVRR